MSPSASQIEREVEASRANLEETVEALRDKMSLGQMVDEAASYFKDSGGGDLVANLGAQIRDNPLPLALVGLGLVWLMSGRGQPHISSRRADVYGSGYDPDFGFEGRDYRGMGRERAADYDGASRYDSGLEADADRTWSEAGSTAADEASVGEGVGDMLEGAGEGLRRAAHETRDAAAGVASGIRSAASTVASAAGATVNAVGSAASGIGSATSRVGRTAYAAGGAAAGAARHAGGAAWNGGSRAYRGASHLGSGASRLGGGVRRSFSDVLENEPLVIGALGLAVGAAIGALLPRTQTEDRYFGETSDQLRETAESFGREKLEQGKAVAEEVYRTAKEKAEETGLTAAGDDSLVGKVGDVARATIEKVRESAADAGLVAGAKPGEKQQRESVAAGEPLDDANSGQAKQDRGGTV